MASGGCSRRVSFGCVAIFQCGVLCRIAANSAVSLATSVGVVGNASPFLRQYSRQKWIPVHN